MIRHVLIFSLLVVGFGTTTPAHAQPATNLLVNGDAEAGTGSTGGGVPVPGWTSTNGATVVQYGVPAFPDVTSPGPSERGVNFFAGGQNDAFIPESQLVQTIDLSSMATEIDGGTTPFTLCGYLGGFSNQEDGVSVTTRFESADAVELDRAVIGPVTEEEREGRTGMALRITSGTVPAGTRTVVVSMDFELFGGFYIDGYADNIWLTFAGCPEVPTTTTTSTTSSTTTSSTTTSTTTTSTTSSTSTSVTTSTTTSSTTPTTSPITPPSTTTTTLPNDPCDSVPDAATFASLDCRLASLAGRIGAATGLGALQSKSSGSVTTAANRLHAAAAQCRTGNRKGARANLKQLVNVLARFGRRLSGHGAIKHLDGALRTDLVDTARAIAGDARRLRSTVTCPADALP